MGNKKSKTVSALRNLQSSWGTNRTHEVTMTKPIHEENEMNDTTLQERWTKLKEGKTWVNSDQRQSSSSRTKSMKPLLKMRWCPSPTKILPFINYKCYFPIYSYHIFWVTNGKISTTFVIENKMITLSWSESSKIKYMSCIIIWFFRNTIIYS